MNIKILGPGCARCHQLGQTTKEVVKELGLDASIEEVKDIGHFLDFTSVHHDNPLACFGDNRHIMGNKHDSGFRSSFLHFEHKFQYLGLYGHIESGCGFVGDQQGGIARKCHGDHDPLSHTTGKLVRVFLQPFFRIGDSHQV